jgi:pimeloyl-ACP methyl ester carboxylesterase
VSRYALFIHSTGLGPFMWSKLAPAVPAPLQALLPANVGYPPDPPLAPGAPFTIDQDLARLEAAIPADAREVHLVGHSYGALLALHLARRLGPLARSAWLYEPVLFGALARHRDRVEPAVAGEIARLFDHPWFAREPSRGGSPEWLEYFIDFWNGPGTWAAMPPPARAVQLALGWKMACEVRACVADTERFEAHALDLPLTLAHGEGVPRAGAAMTRALAEVNPDATLEAIAGAGHMGPLSHPARVAPSIARHFERLPTTSG